MKNGNQMAFPVQDHDNGGVLDAQPGLTKRELFAGMAMQGLAAHDKLDWDEDVSPSDLASAAVLAADALLAALEGKSDE